MIKNSKQWLIALAAMILTGLVGIAALVICVDPFFHYHGPVEGFPYQIDHQLSQNPGMAEHMEYDSVLLGSSMTVNFEADWFRQDMDLNLLKLNYNGAYPRDVHNIMEQVDCNRANGPLKKVFLGVDLASYTGGVEETKYPLPEYLYNKNIFDDVNYWYNKGVLLDYIIKPVLMGDPPTDMSSVYSSEWWLKDLYGKAHVLENYQIPEKNDAYFPEDMFIEGLENNLRENILPVIDSHPDTEFVIFFPPYSILYWYEYVQNNQMDAALYEYRYCMEKLLEKDNVELYFFPGEKEIVCDLDLYADTGHYKQEINRYMTDCFLDGTDRVTKDNYEEMLAEFKRMIDAYDYEALLDAQPAARGGQ